MSALSESDQLQKMEIQVDLFKRNLTIIARDGQAIRMITQRLKARSDASPILALGAEPDRLVACQTSLLQAAERIPTFESKDELQFDAIVTTVFDKPIKVHNRELARLRDHESVIANARKRQVPDSKSASDQSKKQQDDAKSVLASAVSDYTTAKTAFLNKRPQLAGDPFRLLLSIFSRFVHGDPISTPLSSAGDEEPSGSDGSSLTPLRRSLPARLRASGPLAEPNDDDNFINPFDCGFGLGWGSL
jgi:hypothetical protein